MICHCKNIGQQSAGVDRPGMGKWAKCPIDPKRSGHLQAAPMLVYRCGVPMKEINGTPKDTASALGLRAGVPITHVCERVDVRMYAMRARTPARPRATRTPASHPVMARLAGVIFGVSMDF